MALVFVACFCVIEFVYPKVWQENAIGLTLGIANAALSSLARRLGQGGLIKGLEVSPIVAVVCIAWFWRHAAIGFALGVGIGMAVTTVLSRGSGRRSTK